MEMKKFGRFRMIDDKIYDTFNQSVQKTHYSTSSKSVGSYAFLYHSKYFGRKCLWNAIRKFSLEATSLFHVNNGSLTKFFQSCNKGPNRLDTSPVFSYEPSIEYTKCLSSYDACCAALGQF